ncbi:hypothetical protein [Blastococcus mobilis]|uniref:Uncharacterized protein n=1 Tax=Blastococcus mobilis TaxID=1938746 RepID=A0A238VBC8_9ACTN|nr:hypothetical protein [Blastococcus mobilis]SNR30839.1 hypothetical protein SAMN06272737_102242 [Blastococcus mobilis]
MSTADDPDRSPSADRTGRKRGRLLIAGAVLGAVVLVLGFMLLVSQCGTGGDSEIYGRGAVPSSAGISLVQ